MQDTAQQPLLMNSQEILQVIQSLPGGPSANGLSKKEVASFCGKRAILDAELGRKDEDDEDGEVATGTGVGTVYHKHHELYIKGRMVPFKDLVFDSTDPAWTANSIEGQRLWRGYQRDWGDVGQRFGGRIIAAEFDLPGDNPEIAAQFKEEFGDEITGRVDAMIEVENPAIALTNTGLYLERGVYLIDFKTAKSHSEKHKWQFQYGLQGAAYLYMYNKMHPERPAVGCIFDVIYKHKKLLKEPLRRKDGSIAQNASYGAYLQTPDDFDRFRIKNAVSLADYNIKNRVINPFNCFVGFKPCPHFGVSCQGVA